MKITDWVDRSFPKNENGNITLEEVAAGGRITISPAQLGALLGTLTAPPAYADLSALPIASSGGWQKYFDDWKAAGLVS